MADSENDPVNELLLSLKGRKSNKKVDSRKIDEAINFHNHVINELEQIRPKHDDDDKPQTVLEKLQQENAILKRELVENRNKLNKLTRDQREPIGTIVVQSAEVADPFRPSLLAEEFRSIYDNEWKNAFSELDKLKKNETQVLGILVAIIKGADQICSAAMDQHLSRIEQAAMEDMKVVKITDAGTVATKEETDRSKRLIKEYIKSLGHLSIPGLMQLFSTNTFQQIKTENELNGTLQQVDHFINKLINALWKMKMADPPLALVWQEGGEPFTKKLIDGLQEEREPGCTAGVADRAFSSGWTDIV